MTESKPWYLSRTIWASLVAVAAALSSAFGHTVDDGMQTQLTEAAMQIVAVGASLIAVFGRLAATSIIE
ncbi:hypothetical protein [Ahrensia sp. R2A130]|uniref:hypothetical protein n=1 Tax=Ahrensia sp. R2A130 TaxID=744979 RepID=UPI0001E0E8CA|nr:hypothetical protein [Ahrensia sp. R2A130]EFL88968.1 conserved hypothetical protein [Ahrensia sp. R2A130]